MTAEGLIDAFTNPMKFASDPNMTADLVMGMTNQVGNEIDEFVTGTLENNLDRPAARPCRAQHHPRP